MTDFDSQFPLLMPSILAANQACVWSDLQPLLMKNRPSWLHFDVMDGNFVPNLSFGPQLLRDLREKIAQSGLPMPRFDVHLMLSSPRKFLDVFGDAGAASISIHSEIDDDVSELLRAISRRGILSGLALNPETPAEKAFPLLHQADFLLMMTVRPGFGGQAFREAMLAKIATVRHFRRESRLHFRIAVDGGINLETIPAASACGAEILVAGSAIFRAENPADAFTQLLTAAKTATSESAEETSRPQ